MTKRKRQPGVLDGTENSNFEDSSVAASPTTPKSRLKSKNSTPKSTGSRARATSLHLTSPTGDDSPLAATTKLVPKVQQNRIKAGLDFGTTNSGFAHVMSLKCDARDVEVNVTWPSGPGTNQRLEKVPSRFALASENQDVKGMEEDCWGYGVPPRARSYGWFKLLLDKARKTEYDIDDVAGELTDGLLELPANMTAKEAVTAYLTKMYEHCMEMLEQRYTANILTTTPIDFWLTVPATWQAGAVDDTKAAAGAAGFGTRDGDTLNVITEPEASGIAILTEQAERNPELIKEGDNAMICDLGGGTQDMQILTIKAVKPQVQLEEAVPGQAGKCGSTFIDQQFYQWMGETFGEAFTKLPKAKIGQGSKFMKDWEGVKAAFTGAAPNKQYYVPLPALGQALGATGDHGVASTAYDFMDNAVVLLGEDVERFFQPVIEKAFNLVDQQVSSLRKRKKGSNKLQIICLCGGLGESMYIWKTFDDFCKARFKGAVKLFTDKQAWSAVVRGAVIRGLNGNTVLSRKAKRAYGMAVHRPFREGIDREEDSYHCPIGGKRAVGYVAWFIVVGKNITPNMQITTALYDTFEEGVDEPLEYELFSCALDTPPETSDHPSVEFECSMTIELSRAKKKQRDGEVVRNGHRKVGVKIVVKMGIDKGTLSVEAKSDRAVLGVAKLDYGKTHGRQYRPRAPGAL